MPPLSRLALCCWLCWGLVAGPISEAQGQRFNRLPVADKPHLIDSLQNLLANQTGDTLQVQRLSQLAVYYLGVDYTKALAHAHSSIELAEKIGYLRGKASGHLNQGLAYEEQGLHVQAIASFTRALALFRQAGDAKGVGICLNNLGNSHYSLNNLEQALASFQESLALKEKMRDQAGITVSYNNLGYTYVLLGRPHEALPYLEKALARRQAANQPQLLPAPLYNLARCHFLLGDQAQAFALATQSLALARRHQQWQRIEEASQGLAEMSAVVGRPDSAYHYAQLRTEARDTLAARNQRQALAELAVKYQVEELEQRLAKTRQQQGWQLAWFAAIGGGLGLLAVLFFARKRQVEHTNQKLIAQKEQIEGQIEDLTDQRDLLAKNKQQLRLANEELTTLNDQLDQIVREQLKLTQAQQVQLIEYAHINAHNLRAPVSRVKGLAYVLARETEADNQAYILQSLTEAAAELDSLTQEISRLLETQGDFSRHDLAQPNPQPPVD
jgi:tetratricopeptide (TPR) repeat protein/gas vesicle protein